MARLQQSLRHGPRAKAFLISRMPEHDWCRGKAIGAIIEYASVGKDTNNRKQ